MTAIIQSPCQINFILFSNPGDQIEIPEPMTDAVAKEVAERIAFGYINPIGEIPDEVNSLIPSFSDQADEAQAAGATLPPTRVRRSKS